MIISMDTEKSMWYNSATIRVKGYLQKIYNKHHSKKQITRRIQMKEKQPHDYIYLATCQGPCQQDKSRKGN